MTTVPALSTPPSRSDPTNFNTRADTFLGELSPWGAAINIVASEVNTAANTASNAAITATTKAGEASSSAASALNSKNLAENAANEAEVLTEKYQGALSSDPTLDKSGAALTAGDWYVNTSSGFLRVYNGVTWVQGISSIVGVSSINGLTGDVTGFVTEADSQTLTNKTLTSPSVASPTMTGSIYNNGSMSSVINAVAALTIDCSSGNYFTKTIASSSTFVFSNAPASKAYDFTLELTHTGGTVSWPASVRWPGNVAPTLTTARVHLFVFITDDGGVSWRGVFNINYSS